MRSRLNRQVATVVVAALMVLLIDGAVAFSLAVQGGIEPWRDANSANARPKAEVRAKGLRTP